MPFVEFLNPSRPRVLAKSVTPFTLPSVWFYLGEFKLHPDADRVWLAPRTACGTEALLVEGVKVTVFSQAVCPSFPLEFLPLLRAQKVFPTPRLCCQVLSWYTCFIFLTNLPKICCFGCF